MILYNFISYTSWYLIHPDISVVLVDHDSRNICRNMQNLWSVEKFCRKILSKPVEKCCRNQSKFVEICRNLSKCRKMLSKPVEKCCRNVENVFFDFSYPLAIRVKKVSAGSTHTRACVRGIFFWIFFWIFFEFFLELFNK